MDPGAATTAPPPLDALDDRALAARAPLLVAMRALDHPCHCPDVRRLLLAYVAGFANGDVATLAERVRDHEAAHGCCAEAVAA